MDKEIMYRCENMIRAIERLNGKCEDNMRRLNEMMLEMKGIIAMVRPSARRNDWYKDEIEIPNTNDKMPKTFKYLLDQDINLVNCLSGINEERLGATDMK